MVRSEAELRKLLEVEAGYINKNSPPALTIEHLEKAIRLYNELYSFKKPSIQDRAGFTILKSQYKVLCAINRHKPDRKALDGGF